MHGRRITIITYGQDYLIIKYFQWRRAIGGHMAMYEMSKKKDRPIIYNTQIKLKLKNMLQT